MNLPSLPQDKANHLAYGAALACLVALLAGPIAASAVCTAFAVGKELRDWWSGLGNPELLDALATMGGGACVVLPLWLAGVR